MMCEGKRDPAPFGLFWGPLLGGAEVNYSCGGESGRGPSALLRVLGLFRFFPCFSNKPCVLQMGAKEVQGQGKKDNKNAWPRLDIGESCNPSSLRDRLTSQANRMGGQ